MKLKRYVLLDNNRIVDLKDEQNYTVVRYTKNQWRWILVIHNVGSGFIIATSDDATDLVFKGDMAKHYNRRGFVETNQVYKVEYQWVKFRDETVHKDKILAIYKLIGKDYICAWERRKENE